MMASSKSRTIVRVLGVALLIAMLFGLGSSVAAAPPGQEGGLFTAVDIEGSGDPADDPTIVRIRFVEPDFDLLDGADGFPVADVLELNLFEDVAFTAVLDHAESNSSGSLSWMGHLKGMEYGSALLVVKDGVMVGSVKMLGASYQISYVGNGVHAIQEMNEAAFPPELEPIPVTASEDALVEALSAPMADDGSTIDVLVIYTGDARVAVGGTTAMENLIDLAISETNQAYIHSNISQRVNLVHKAEVPYDETGFNWFTTLSRLQTHGDSYFDDVTQPGTGLRDTYCADEVVLIVEDNAYCGLAYLMTTVSSTFEDYAFALVCHDCATGYYSFGHEMGHNMGATHDRANASGPGAYDYSYGYQAPDKAFRTVMAYDCPGGCPRIGYWSNPDVSYRGQPTGVLYTAPDSADNRRTLNNTASTVANFRDSSVCAPTIFDIGGYVRNSSGTGISGVAVGFGGWRPAVTTDGSGYYSQSGFSSGTYTVTFGSSGYFFSPVGNLVTVSGANVTHDATGSPIIPASLPFYDGFESGDLGSAWAVETDYEGRARADTYNPHWGSYSLLLDDEVNDSLYSHASAILALDLSGQSQVGMSFWWRDFDDEHDGDDGVFISDDYGATWHQAFPFTSTSTFTQAVVDLDAAASTAEMSLNDHFLIKFQFYDNWPIGYGDGYGIDDVTVDTGTTVGPLMYASHTVNDDIGDDSDGNDNGVVNCGESIELYVDLYNQGGGTAIGISTTISSSDPYITFTQNTDSDYLDISGWGMDDNSDDFEFDASPDVPHGHRISFSLAISATNGSLWYDSFAVRAYCATDLVYLPLLMESLATEPPGGTGVTNGDFESGSIGWIESSTNGRDLIVPNFTGPQIRGADVSSAPSAY